MITFCEREVRELIEVMNLEGDVTEMTMLEIAPILSAGCGDAWVSRDFVRGVLLGVLIMKSQDRRGAFFGPLAID